MTISALPTPPSRAAAPDTFASQADALLGALPAFVTEANALQADVNAKQITTSTAAATAVENAGIAITKAGEAASSAGTADAARITAESARNAAAGYRDNAAISAGQAAAAALSASNDADTCAGLVAGIADGPVTSVNGKTGIVALTPADIGAEPAQAAATQAEMEAGTEADIRSMSPLRVKQAIDVLAGSKLIRSARAANTILGTADKGALIDITSGTFTQTFAACSTLGNGWWCYIRNSGAGDITLDPNASETIDGLTSYIVYPREVRLVQCDGVALRSVVLNSFYRVFTTSGTFVKPPGYSAFEGTAWGGGAGAKWAQNVDSYYQFSGGGGGCMPFREEASSLAASETVAVGAGGIRTTTWNLTTNAGGNTVFAGVTAFGGDANGTGGGTADGVNSGISSDIALGFVSSGGVPTTIQFAGAPLRNAGVGNPNVSSYSVYGGGGGMGINGNNSPNTYNAAGGFSFYGGGGGASLNGARGGSRFGGRGADASNAAEAPGGGGHGSSVATYGNGARGELRIWGII